MKRFLIDALPYLAIIAIAAIVAFGVPLFAPVQAASPAATGNACVEIGNVRGAYVGKCIDPDNGLEFYFGPGWIEVLE